MSICVRCSFYHQIKNRFLWPPLFPVTVGNKSGAIVFIDELDAIGTKRFGGEQSGDREVQRTMLELLSQLDGFSSDEKIKVVGPYFDSTHPTQIAGHCCYKPTRCS